ncbi:putative calcium-independent phospholipase A2-gamma, partial [Rhizoctonia solani 123E]
MSSSVKTSQNNLKASNSSISLANSAWSKGPPATSPAQSPVNTPNTPGPSKLRSKGPWGVSVGTGHHTTSSIDFGSIKATQTPEENAEATTPPTTAPVPATPATAPKLAQPPTNDVEVLVPTPQPTQAQAQAPASVSTAPATTMAPTIAATPPGTTPTPSKRGKVNAHALFQGEGMSSVTITPPVATAPSTTAPQAATPPRGQGPAEGPRISANVPWRPGNYYPPAHEDGPYMPQIHQPPTPPPRPPAPGPHSFRAPPITTSIQAPARAPSTLDPTALPFVPGHLRRPAKPVRISTPDGDAVTFKGQIPAPPKVTTPIQSKRWHAVRLETEQENKERLAKEREEKEREARERAEKEQKERERIEEEKRGKTEAEHKRKEETERKAREEEAESAARAMAEAKAKADATDKSGMLGLQDWGSSIAGPSTYGESGSYGAGKGKGSGDKNSQNTPKRAVAPVPKQPRTKRGINILCIDGGGVRGLSSLLLLQEVMNRLQVLEGQGELVKPVDWFDVIAGTGTGGVIACMLGKLGMSINEAVESYTKLTEAVFSNKKKGGITGAAAYKSTTLKESLRAVIQAATGDGDTKMSEGASIPDGCNTLIFATLKDNINASIPVMFRSYQARANRAPDCAMWEALYATMAHPAFFKSIDIAEGALKYSFVGGELGNSNPLAHVLGEVRDLYPGQYVSCIMSVGAGHAHTIHIPSTDRQLASLAMKAMATDSERVAEEMARRFQDTTGVYFRFNVDQGIQDVETDDWEKLGTVGAHTRAYLSKNEVDRGMREATKAMHDRNNALAVAWIDGRVQRTLEPAIVKKCPAPSSYYTGRAKETQGVGSCIVNSGHQQQVCVIYGLGGAGKSQLAFKAIQQNYHHWNHIIYVDAASKQTIERTLGDFAKINLKYLGDTHTLTYTDTLLWLQGTQDSWLLFFDGADDLHLDIRPYFPSYRGSILVTTRLEARIGLAQPPESVYHVSGMDPEDASSLLLRIVNRRAPCESKTAADKNAADALVHDFGFLALAIVHAGAYIAHSTGMSISYYRKLFHKKRQATLEKYKTLPESSKFDNYDKTVYTTWNMCYELLGECRSKGAQELLWLIAFLYHDGITMDIFQRAVTNIHVYGPILPVTELEKHAHAYLQGYLTRVANTEDAEDEESWAENSFMETMGDLAAYSLIEYDRRNKAYTIHVLVQDWVRTIIPYEPNISLEHTAALLAVSIGMNDDPDPDSHDFRVGLGSHVKKVWSASYELLDQKSHHWEVNLNHAVCFANVFKSMKLWCEEEDIRTKVEAASKKLLGLKHPTTLQSTDNLAHNYVNQGWHDRAESLYYEVLEMRRELYRVTHGEEHEDILISKRYLATIYEHQGRLGEAIPFWEDVVQGYRVSKGGN